jgi:multidrug resistance efflux pump
MAGQIPLFEIVDGLMRQVDPAKADAMRVKHRTKRVAPLVVDVILTTKELKQLEEDAAVFKARRAEQAKMQAINEASVKATEKAREAAKAKLKKLGLTDEEVEALKSQ